MFHKRVVDIFWALADHSDYDLSPANYTDIAAGIEIYCVKYVKVIFCSRQNKYSIFSYAFYATMLKKISAKFKQY
jgi:hypothetical protein